MEAQVLQGIAAPEFFSEEGCYIVEMLNDGRSPDLSMARARVAPGNTTAWHRLEGIAERYVITQGKGVVEIGDLKTEVRSGDAVLIPPGVAQRIQNTGDTDLLFYCLCTPRFRAEAYRRI